MLVWTRQKQSGLPGLPLNISCTKTLSFNATLPNHRIGPMNDYIRQYILPHNKEIASQIPSDASLCLASQMEKLYPVLIPEAAEQMTLEQLFAQFYPKFSANTTVLYVVVTKELEEIDSDINLGSTVPSKINGQRRDKKGSPIKGTNIKTEKENKPIIKTEPGTKTKTRLKSLKVSRKRSFSDANLARSMDDENINIGGGDDLDTLLGLDSDLFNLSQVDDADNDVSNPQSEEEIDDENSQLEETALWIREDMLNCLSE
ncbi:hypothetical protein BGW36DRAFT_360198 [Talaromyces proteolyticus]|uniref:Uncharacterized protein n=1 Tax=Talaromyces proteolyticus TaxID=1131652 RepID=A0AAD4KPG5_9EURO|nr:uncharacterized protein BGW36DRAFT_360198 [Talaromyces proteolyticus]KAH8696355.1 hypothetical protein BGW36DRAFT_360198 [Talaromyces proteolyticus]